MRPFESIQFCGTFQVNQKPGQDWACAFEQYCHEARRIGLTHIQVNFIADPYHAIVMEQPHNHYAWFASFGPELDMFVSSSLNRGVYPQAYLARNRQRLIQSAQSARKAGLKPMFLLVEPRVVPERFFQKHPSLRGPRVDNPIASTTPWYALCTDVPEVQQHYREMMAKIMKDIPDLAGLSLFTHDSGAGFCYGGDLYAGPNGPRHCRNENPGQRVANFLQLLRDVAAEVNPDFFAALSIGVEGQERIDFMNAPTEGTPCEVRNQYSWHGGLEDQWVAHQYGRKIEEVGYDQARKERVDEFRANAKRVMASGKEPVALTNMPDDGYSSPLTYVIHPRENIRILESLRSMGIRSLNNKGSFSSAVRHDVTREAFCEYLANPDRTPDAILTDIAEAWVAPEHAPVLINAWDCAEQAFVTRPLWTHITIGHALLPGPLVPAPDTLSMDELEYFWRNSWSDHAAVKGRHYLDWIRVNDEKERTWMLETYLNRTLPLLEETQQHLQAQIERCEDTQSREILAEQADHIRSFYLWQKSSNNWLEAGCYLMPPPQPDDPKRSFPDIVDSEIQVTQDMIELYQGRLEEFIFTAQVSGVVHERDPEFMDQLQSRIETMKRHKNDAVVPICLE